MHGKTCSTSLDQGTPDYNKSSPFKILQSLILVKISEDLYKRNQSIFFHPKGKKSLTRFQNEPHHIDFSLASDECRGLITQYRSETIAQNRSCL